MVETTEMLLRRQGYAATSWRTVVEQAGAPWGSAHHHFPGGKEQLAGEAIALGGDHVAAALRSSLDAHSCVRDAVRAWFTAAAENLAHSGFTDGCPVATVALETASESPTLADACDRAMAAWETMLAEALVQEGTPSQDAHRLATNVLISLEGALLLARVRRDTAPLQLAADMLARLLPAPPA
jgi:TetR/AcrR family transcriptional repressor of lmrAB and yxaGH operons